MIPVALDFAPHLVLVSAGFDAHRDDPLGGCLLDAESFAQMACHVRDAARTLGGAGRGGARGRLRPDALAASVVSTVAALGGAGEAESIAPDPLVTSRAAAHVSHFWEL